MRATRPLFEVDPGWLFIIAGLAICAAGVLLPAQADLRGLQEQLAVLQDEEARAYQRLAAHADFIDHVDRAEPAIIRRLAAAQLNLVPEGDRPVILAASNSAPVTSWIDSTLSTDIRPPPIEPVSMLSRWANGPSRLWMFGGGIFAIFIGLLISPAASRHRHAQRESQFASHIVLSDGTSITLADQNDDSEALAARMLARYGGEAPASSLPETVDIESPVDLRQQADTVDLDEDDLPALCRTVIDDDTDWHARATIEHAGEVIVEGKEISPHHADHAQLLLTGEVATDVEETTDASVGVDVQVVADAQLPDELIDEPECESAGLACEGDVNDDDIRAAETAMLHDEDEPHADEIDQPVKCDDREESSCITEHGEIPLAVQRDDPNSVADDSETRHDDHASASQNVRRVGKSAAGRSGSRRKRPRKRDDSTHADAIPFLRYRPHDDDDDDEDEVPDMIVVEDESAESVADTDLNDQR